MKLHELKTINPFFREIYNGIKTFEIRINDRDFRKGDCLLLREYFSEDYRDNCYNKCDYGQEILCLITSLVNSVQFNGLSNGYVCMSIKILYRSD